MDTIKKLSIRGGLWKSMIIYYIKSYFSNIISNNETKQKNLGNILNDCSENVKEQYTACITAIVNFKCSICNKRMVLTPTKAIHQHEACSICMKCYKNVSYSNGQNF